MATESPAPITKCTWSRWLRRIGAVLLVFFVLFIAAYLEENWRGAHAWSVCERELAAQGEQLAWAPFIPPPIPDSENLAMAPVFVREFQYGPDPKTGTYTFGSTISGFSSKDLKDMPYPGGKPLHAHLGSWETARHTDLAEYADYYRSRAEFPHGSQPQPPEADVLLALTLYGPFLDELSQAAEERPLTRFPVDWYRKIVAVTPTPHYRVEQQIFSTLSLRAAMRLAAGKAPEALRDVTLSLRLSRDMSSAPLLIAPLVQYVGVGFTLSPVWEGLADRRWSATELAYLQDDLGRFDLLAGCLATLRGERATILRFVDTWEHERSAASYLPLEINAHFLEAVGPPGWFDLNKVIIARWKQDYLINAIDLKMHRVFRDKPAAGTRVLAAMPVRPTTAIAKIALFAPQEMIRHPAKTQTNLDEAMVACALERFFLDHQSYPDRLDKLVPGYLASVPNDIMDGSPLRYRQTPDGRYLLYSIGWNSRDDGGSIARNDRGQVDSTQGDWVWRYSDPQPSPSLPISK